jgi:hypothetical protein
MSILICGITTTDPCNNKRRLKVRMGTDGSLTYRLTAYMGSTGFSLNNLQLRVPLPEMRRDKLEDTFEDILRALRSGVQKPGDINMYVQRDKNACPHCGGEL